MAAIKVIAFVNAASGGNKGAVVIDILEKLIGKSNVHDIKKDGGPEKGLTEHCADPSEEVRIIVAGGDGTFSWVATSVDKKNLTHVNLVLIPLGSGNDMSRALGWGRKYPGDARIVEYVDWLRRTSKHKLDVWRLNALEDPSKVASSSSNGPTEHSARPLMCNYLSLGADAYVELAFNQLRWNNPDKYKSRLGNFAAHLKVGAKYVVRSKKRKYFVNDHIDTLIVDGKSVTLPDNLQALIILNIPSYGAGTQPWGFPRGTKPSHVVQGTTVSDMLVNDGIFEVIGLRGLPHYGTIKVFHTDGVRVTQGQSLKITLKSDATPFQVDGEPWEQRGGEVTVEKGNPLGVLVGPVWKESSRKNAKFANDADSVSPIVVPEGKDYESHGVIDEVIETH